MKKLLIHIRLSPTQLRWCLGSILAINLLVLAGTWAANALHVKGYGLSTALRLLDLAMENTIVTWYSSMLLLSVAIMSAVCFSADWQRFHDWRDRYLSGGWLVFSMIFVTLSFDEIGSFHETIGDTRAFNIFDGYSGWALFYIVILLVGGFMLTFSFVRLIRSKWSVAFAVAGLLLFLSNPLQENYEIAAYQSAPDPDLWVRPLSLLLLEEGSEIIASTCFLIATAAYMLYITKQQSGDSLQLYIPHIDINLSFSRQTAFLFLYLVIFLLAAGLAVAGAGTSITTGHEAGIPKNWFPSAIAFVVFMSSLYLFHAADQADRNNRLSYLLLAFISVSVSMYYGSNLYAHPFWEKSQGILLGYTLKLFCMLAAVFLLARLVVVVKDKWSRIQTAAWAVLLLTAFSLHNLYAAELAFAAFASLLLALTSHIHRWQPIPTEALVQHS